uniref:C3HC-type domain-containing protein n=1 Tax=Heterorhabditis bacteriophora TaxID=37862 RepID=A0A1I7XCL9_HETBA
MANEDLENGTQILDESSLHKMRDLKRKVSGKLLTLFEAISSPIPSKRATAQDEALSTYQILVKSYIPSLWTGNEISPRELAVHGWKCIGKNKAKCISCGRLLYTTVPRITEVNIDVYNKCLKRVRDHIVISHELTCIYRSAYIDFHLKLNNACAVKEIIKERLETYHIADLNLVNLEI